MSQVAPTTKFRVPVRDLPLHRTVEVGTDYVAKVLAGLPMREALGADVEAGHGALDVELYADGNNVYANGTMRGHVVVACSRCVGEARIDVDETIRVTFMPEAELAGTAEEQAVEGTSGAEPDAEEGVELADQDLDLFPYDGETVDLEPLVREHLVLAVPYAPLCREDCKGLCPQCGIDRNTATCACEKPGDPRFAALKGLKLPS
jgi:uncharacterized protein